MKKYLLILLFCCQPVFSQSDTLYLYVEDPIIQYGCDQQLTFGFSIKSKDDRFITDYYKFSIPNIKSFGKEGNYEYYTIDEIKKETDIKKINYEIISAFIEAKSPWQVHNELSLKSKIYLIEKGDTKYYILPLIYEGTKKNVVQTAL